MAYVLDRNNRTLYRLLNEYHQKNLGPITAMGKQLAIKGSHTCALPYTTTVALKLSNFSIKKIFGLGPQGPFPFLSRVQHSGKNWFNRSHWVHSRPDWVMRQARNPILAPVDVLLKNKEYRGSPSCNSLLESVPFKYKSFLSVNGPLVLIYSCLYCLLGTFLD